MVKERFYAFTPSNLRSNAEHYSKQKIIRVLCERDSDGEKKYLHLN
jgi:hypothetical protein